MRPTSCTKHTADGLSYLTSLICATGNGTKLHTHLAPMRGRGTGVHIHVRSARSQPRPRAGASLRTNRWLKADGSPRRLFGGILRFIVLCLRHLLRASSAHDSTSLLRPIAPRVWGTESNLLKQTAPLMSVHTIKSSFLGTENLEG